VKVPGDVKVTRKARYTRIRLGEVRPILRCRGKNPEFTLSEVELITARLAPSEVGSTFAEGFAPDFAPQSDAIKSETRRI
jgi:hypothetical protein